MSLVLALWVGAQPDPAPTRQALVFFNARLALRDKDPTKALKLWLVRNSLRDQGLASEHDEAFRSVVWAATGSLGLCQDGLARDEVGLWPIALHNALLVTAEPDDLPSPYEAFDVGRQQRLISLDDVLDDDELEAVAFSRTSCFAARLAMIDLGINPLLDLDDRLIRGEVVRRVLSRSLATVDRSKVTSLAAVEARLFDLDLQLTELRNRRKRERAAETAADVRSANMSPAAGKAAGRLEASLLDEPGNVAFLRRTLEWKPAEWLTLSRSRREYLFEHARHRARDPSAREALALGVLDLLVARGQGAEAQAWVGFLDEASRAQLIGGRRGERLLALPDDSGFKERSVIALHRGVAHLERGELVDALRSFAFALKHSTGSAASTAVHALGRRWLSYVLARHQATGDVLITLKALVPRQDYNPVIEDLVWAAALRADATSFDRLAASALRGTGFDDRLSKLELLAHGQAGALLSQLKATSVDAPFEALRFCKVLLDALEREQADVRRANRPLLLQLLPLLDGIATAPDVAKAIERLARELASRAQSVLEGLGVFVPGGDARALGLGHSAFAGALRLAPADPLPWPFSPPAVEAPNAFTALKLEPIEWRDEQGALVFGWRVTE